jgi:RIO kinase 1
LNQEAFEHFFDEGLIEKVLRPIKSGKEASVHLCRADPSTTGEELVALKVFHPLGRRDFRDESIYRDGEFIKERRVRTAVIQRTKFGREVQGGIWVHREWESLKALWAAGAPVPRPIESTGDAIMMTYIGDDSFAAPQLRDYRPDDRAEAEALFDQLLRAIELMLYHDVIHGDLSPYNVLVWGGEITVIDFPQAVDAKKNRFGASLLERDVRRICEYFERHGVNRPAGRIAADLWTGWEFADLVPEELRPTIA